MMVLIIILLLFVIVASEKETAPYTSDVLPGQNRTNILLLKSHKYYFGTAVKVNFFQAHILCKAFDMDLVYIDSYEENNRLGIFATQIGHGHDHYWTSANNLHDSQKWSWLATGKPLKYTNWYPGEPNLGASGSDTNERCVEARTLDKGGFSWNNVPCDRLYYYICKGNRNVCSRMAEI